MKRLAGLFLLTIFLTFTPAVLAQTPGRLRTASPSSTPPVREKVATRVSEIKSNSKFVSGKITLLTDTTLTIQPTGEPSITVTTSSTTKFIDLLTTKRTITIKSLRAGDLVSVVGVSPAESSGTARLVARTLSPKTRATLVGTVTNVQMATSSGILKTATSSAEITLKVKTGTSSAVLVNTTTKLKITGLIAPTLNDLKVGQRALVTGAKGAPFTASNFVVISQNSLVTPTPSKVSTKSATPTIER